MNKTIVLPIEQNVVKKPSSKIEKKKPIPVTEPQDEYTITAISQSSKEVEIVQLHTDSKNTSIEKEKQKRVVTHTKKWRFTEEDYDKENQLILLKSIQHIESKNLGDHQRCILQQLNQKITGYKSQDIAKNIYNPIVFVTLQQVIELLIASKLQCHYCKTDVKVLYEIVREPLQWTLDRIDNDYGHNNGNLFVACLSCNLRRKTIYHEKYVMTKICTNVIKLS